MALKGLIPHFESEFKSVLSNTLVTSYLALLEITAIFRDVNVAWFQDMNIKQADIC